MNPIFVVLEKVFILGSTTCAGRLKLYEMRES